MRLQMEEVMGMARAIDVAEYFLSKDPERKLFTKKWQTRNDVQENYSVLRSRRNMPAFAPELVAFLDKLYLILENAPLNFVEYEGGSFCVALD